MYEFPYGAGQQLNLDWIINEIITLHKRLDPDYELPNFNNAFPYMNLNQLNLDWILRELKAIKDLAPSEDAQLLEMVANALIANTYDAETQYNVNDIIYNEDDNRLYKCITATPAGGEPFDSNKWVETDVSETLTYLLNNGGGGGTPNAVTNVRYSNHKIEQEINGNYSEVIKLEDNPTNNSGRIPSSKAFYNLKNSTDYALPLLETKNYLSKSMESEAETGVTYADLFGLYNEMSCVYLDAWTIAPMYVSAGTPSIVENINPVSQGHNVLKFFGTTTQQVSNPINIPWFNLINGHKYYIAFCINISRFVTGVCGIRFTAADALPSMEYAAITNGWELKSEIATYTGATGIRRFYLGTINSANADCMIACPVALDLTAAGIDTLTLAEVDDIYKQYITITDAIEFRNRKLKEKRPVLAATVLDADSASDRFLAAKQLFDIARKKLINPYYSPKTHEFTVASKGAVCKLSEYNTAMYENYPFDFIYANNETVSANPASCTKVMNAITALRYVTDLNASYTIESGDIVGGSGSAYAAGDILTIRDLLHAMFLESSNTCANALGTYTGRIILNNPSASNTAARNAFVNRMRSLSSEIGCTQSFWKNASGYNQTDTYTTTADLMQILFDAASFPDILRIWNKQSYDINVKGTDPRTVSITTTVHDTNLENYYYIFGGKTGQSNVAQALVIICEPK